MNIPPSGYDILDWWRSMEGTLPILSAVALRNLVLPITTCDVESSFSFYRHTRNAYQDRLTDESLDLRLSYHINGIVR